MADFIINSLRGGVNEFDSPTALQSDQCTAADNVEWWLSTCGEKRKGTNNVTLGGTGYTNGIDNIVPFLFQHLPSNEAQTHSNPGDQQDAELWAYWTDQGANSHLERFAAAAWADVTPVDAIDSSSSRPFQMTATSLHGKMFHAYRNSAGVDRLHVWDGTTHRRVGLPQAFQPSVANTGSGTFSGFRAYRTRNVVEAAGVVIRRSEPSPAIGITPSGSGSGIQVTNNANADGSPTHWEVEASIDNANYYRIATVLIATTTYTDTISAYTVGYQSTGTLSEQIGAYVPPWSARFVIADQDRLMVAGAWETKSYGSTVGWTPVANDPGVGNDERIPVTSANTISLDGQDGGDITAISTSINGYIFVFKYQRIYKLTRTNNVVQAYTSLLLTTSRGAMGGSLVNGIDENGNPCLYFLDPRVGPCRIGSQGLQTCGYDVLKTWSTVNVDSFAPPVGLYYPNKQQVHYWIATGTSNYPNKKLVLQTNNIQTVTAPSSSNLPTYGGEARRGWSTWSTGRSVGAVSACLFSANINANISSGGATPLSLNWVPFVGLITGTNRNNIQLCDVGSLDDGVPYSASITTRPEISGNLTKKFGARAGNVIMTAMPGVTISIAAVRDFGVEIHQVDGVSLSPTAAETQVIVPLDNLFSSEMYALQISFGDLAAPSGLWQVNGIAITNRDEEGQ